MATVLTSKAARAKGHGVRGRVAVRHQGDKESKGKTTAAPQVTPPVPGDGTLDGDEPFFRGNNQQDVQFVWHPPTQPTLPRRLRG